MRIVYQRVTALLWKMELKQRQEDHCKFKASLVYVTRPQRKKTKP